MTKFNFSGLSSVATGDLSFGDFILSLFVALILGALITVIYSYRNDTSKGFRVMLAILPALVCVVIMMVSGSLGAGVAVAGTFSLVRFRSVPGTAKEIGIIFFGMAVGLACGMGYPGFAALFAVILCAVILAYSYLDLNKIGIIPMADKHYLLQVTMPEELEYTDVFKDIFEKYTKEATLLRVKTTNLGSLNKLKYDIVLIDPAQEKAMIDEIRCRNGNLEISCAITSATHPEL